MVALRYTLCLLTVSIAVTSASLATTHSWIGANGVNSIPTTASVVRLDPSFDQLVPVGAQPQVIATGFKWSEGPAWITDWPTPGAKPFLLFSDVKANRIFKWSESTGLEVFMENSGCPAGNTPKNLPCEKLTEPGSNGIAYHHLQHAIVICQHGQRQVSMLLPSGQTVVLATHYRGLLLNSPNDLTIAPNGDIYFTDPSYGLNGREQDPLREQYHNGVYRISYEIIKRLVKGEGVEGETVQRMGVLQLFARPNGIALNRDGTQIVVSDAHPDVGRWEICQVAGDGIIYGCKLFQLPISSTQTTWAHLPGNADGLKVDKAGNVWATARGGVHVYNAKGTEIGFIQTGVKSGNVAFGNGHVYICADSQIVRVPIASVF